jgi:hypothetical protein
MTRGHRSIIDCITANNKYILDTRVVRSIEMESDNIKLDIMGTLSDVRAMIS